MAGNKTKHRDKPPSSTSSQHRNEELGLHIIENEAFTRTRTFPDGNGAETFPDGNGVGTADMPVPYKLPHRSPFPSGGARGMPQFFVHAANRTGTFPDGNGVGAADMPVPYKLPHGSPFPSGGVHGMPQFSLHAANRTGTFPDGNGVGPADMPVPYMLPHGSLFPSGGVHGISVHAANRTGTFPDGNGVGAADMPVPYVLPHGSLFPSGGVQGMPQFSLHAANPTGTFPSDASQFQSSWNPMIDCNSMNIPNFEGNTHRLYQLHDHDNSVTADNVTNGITHFNSFQNPQSGRGNAAGGLLMTRQCGEANSGNIHRPQLTGNFLSHGGSTPVSCPTPYPACGELGINNNTLVTGVQSNCQGKLDGNFLTLGVEGNTEARSKSNISHRDISNKIERAVFPQLNTSHGQKANKSSLNPGLKMDGDFPSFQNNAGGCPPSTNGLGVMHGASTGFSLSPLSTLQTPEVDRQCRFLKPSNWNLGLAENMDARFANIDPNIYFQRDLAVASIPMSSSQAGLPDFGQSRVTGLSSLSSSGTRNNAHLTPDQLQKRYMETVRNFSSDSPIVSPFGGVTGSTIRQDQSGQHFPANKSRAAQVAQGGLFLNKIGVQPAGNLRQTQAISPVQPPENFLGPNFTTGQVTPAAKGNEPAQTSNVLLGPPHKRGAIWPPPATPQFQRKRTRKTHPSIHPSIPTFAQIARSLAPLAQTAPSLAPLAQNAPSSLAQIVPALPPLPKTVPLLHIKWQVLDKTPQPSGQKCSLCKRDLSFAPEGRVFLPPLPPAVALLPCGHVFHDHCLQLITPEGQAKDPPCIPCAIGES